MQLSLNIQYIRATIMLQCLCFLMLQDEQATTKTSDEPRQVMLEQSSSSSVAAVAITSRLSNYCATQQKPGGHVVQIREQAYSTVPSKLFNAIHSRPLHSGVTRVGDTWGGN